MQVFRDVIPNIYAYTAPRAERGPNYLLLHAKLVVADAQHAVLASANLTQYALRTHLEVGVGVQGAIAAKLDTLLEHLIASPLVRPVASLRT